MDFELIEVKEKGDRVDNKIDYEDNKSPRFDTANARSPPLTGMKEDVNSNEERLAQIDIVEAALSDVTYSDLDDGTIETFIDLTVPVTYRVKFNFTPEKMMARISKDRLRRLNKVWEKSEEGLTLIEFCKIMILEIPSLKEEKLEMIHGLIRLFKQVDINGDQMMDWSEFVQYMIDQVKTESIQEITDVQGNTISIADQIRMQQASRFNKLQRSGLPRDKGRHRKPINEVIMCPDDRNKDQALVFHSEQETTTVQWYNLKLKSVCTMQVPSKDTNAKVVSIAHQDISKSLYAFGPQGTDAVYGVLCSDQLLYFYIRNRGRIELFYQIKVGEEVRQTKVFFMPKHKAWLTAGIDFKMRQWNISPIAQKNEMGEPFQLHSDLITDCVEIKAPFCIATCSLDRTIVLYDLKNREALRRFSRKHVTGVRQLKYMTEFGGNIISTGFEIYANVWNPQNLFGNAHLGRLKGHKHPIIALDVTQTRPFVFTLDSSNDLIVWDIRNLTSLQMIAGPSAKAQMCHGILAIQGDWLWVYGQRFITYDRQEVFDEKEQEVPDTIENKIAINAFHNTFFQTICIQTPQDLKIYSCLDGRLKVMHQGVFKSSHINCTQILQDKRERKAYIASSEGQINVIDVQSGVCLKQCFENEDTQQALEEDYKLLKKKIDKKIEAKQNAQVAKSITRPPSAESVESVKMNNSAAAFLTEAPTGENKKTNEASGVASVDKPTNENIVTTMVTQEDQSGKRDIVDIILVWEEQMNQIIYADKSGYFVYNESDEKTSDQLRHVYNGHQSPITAIKFSYHLSLIATGTETGEVAVWDYELSQVLGICQGHSQSSGEITAIEFVDPYPIMVTAGLDSKICLWLVRPAPAKQCYLTIGMFYNISFNYVDDSKYPVKTLLSLTGDKLKGFSRGLCMKHSQINAGTYRDYQTNQVLAKKENSVRIDSCGSYRGLSQIKDIRLALLKEALKTNELGQTIVEENFEVMRNEYLPRMEHLDPNYDDTVNEEKVRIYLYLGDDFGIMKQWDLTYLIQQQEIKPCQPVWQTRGDQYFPNRTEEVNAVSYAQRLRKFVHDNNLTQKDRVKDPEDTGLIIRETVAHEKSIMKLNPHNFDGLISVSQDCEVRVWSHGLDLWGIIDCRTYSNDVLWYFPTRDKKEREIQDIIQMQDLSNQMREDDEQAVHVERDSDDDEKDDEQFTSRGQYEKFKNNVHAKKRIKQEAFEKQEKAIIEERREWNIALANSKAKPIQSNRVFVPFNRNLRAIERIEELFEREQQFHQKILVDDEKTEVKQQQSGVVDVVAKTAQQIDKLILQALRKHDKISDEYLSPSARSRRLHQKQRTLKRSHAYVVAIKDSDSGDSRSPVKKSLSPYKSRSLVKKGDSSMNNSHLTTPIKMVRIQDGLKDGHVSNQKSPIRVYDEKTMKKVSIVLSPAHEDQTPPASSLNVGAALRSDNGQPRKIRKNHQGSNLSLLESSVDSQNYDGPFVSKVPKKINLEDTAKIESKYQTTVQPILEVNDGDEENMKVWMPYVDPNKRTLDQLNQTSTLLKKAEVSQVKQAKVEQYVQDKVYVADATDDRKHLLQNKNLPSIRTQLLSIKTKQQKANMNPKYSGNQTTVLGNSSSLLDIAKRDISGNRMVGQINSNYTTSAIASNVEGPEPSPFVMQPQIRNPHEKAMNDLAVIARDLERYNKNRYFNDRARSMMLPSQRQQNNDVNIGDDQSSIHQQQINYQDFDRGSNIGVGGEKVDKIGHTDISIHSSQVQDVNFLRERSDSLMVGDEKNRVLLKVASTDQDTMQKQLRAFQSQLMARESQRNNQIRIRNIANSRTPNDFRRQSSGLNKAGTHQTIDMANIKMKNSQSVARILPVNRNLNLSQLSGSQQYYADGSPDRSLVGGKKVYNYQGPQISVKAAADAALGLDAADRLDINLDQAFGGIRESRNQVQKKMNTDNIQLLGSNRFAAAERGLAEDGSAISFIKDNSSAQLSAAFKQKLLANRSGRNEAQTAAQSISQEQTLARDASLQYIDVGFSIGDASAKKMGHGQTYDNSQRMLQPHVSSMSKVSSIENYSDMDMAQQRLRMPPSSLYEQNAQLIPKSSQQILQSRIKTVSVRPSFSSKKPFISLSTSVSGKKTKDQENWKSHRRTSQQTRMNDVTGIYEQVDLLEIKKNQYLALKQKYAGKDSGMAQLARREAENIQKQRERINELKDFKKMMESLKQTGMSESIKQMHESGATTTNQQLLSATTPISQTITIVKQ